MEGPTEAQKEPLKSKSYEVVAACLAQGPDVRRLGWTRLSMAAEVLHQRLSVFICVYLVQYVLLNKILVILSTASLAGVVQLGVGMFRMTSVLEKSMLTSYKLNKGTGLAEAELHLGTFTYATSQT